MAVKSTVVARIYGVTARGQTQEIHAASVSELTQQLSACGVELQAGKLARLVWANNTADITLGHLRISAIGRVVQEKWGKVAPDHAPSKNRKAAPTGSPESLKAAVESTSDWNGLPELFSSLETLENETKR